MEEYEDWIKHAEEYAIDRRLQGGGDHAEEDAIDRRLKKGGEQVVGRKIDLDDMLDDVSTQDGGLKKCRHAIFLASAGMGKTTLIRWIAQYGAQGKLKNLKGKLIIMPDFRTFPTHKKLHPSQALLGTMFEDQDAKRMKQRYEWLLENSDKVVFLIDSLDTLVFDFDKERPRIDHNTEALPEDILHNLLSGDLFPRSKIISTSREFKVIKMHPKVRPDRCLLLDGLEKESVQDLIGEFLGEEKGKEVKRHIKMECPDVGPLLTMPIFLVLSMIGFVGGGFIPSTMSGILIKFYLGLILSNHAHVKNIRESLIKLMPMSYDGTRHGRVLFGLEHFKRFNIIPEEVPDLGILIPFSTGNYLFSKLMQHESFYLYFNHQTMQECLAALYVLSIDVENVEKFIQTDLFKPNFSVVKRILCGTLLNSQVLEAAKQLIQIPDIDRKESILLEKLRLELEQQQLRLQAMSYDIPDKEKLLEFFIDLNEGKNDLTELIQPLVKKIDLLGVSLSLSDVQAVAFVMKQCDYLRMVNLGRCNLTGEKMEILFHTLKQSNLKIKELNINYNNKLGSGGFHCLGKFIQDHKIKVVEMRDCVTESEYVENLLSGLGNAKVNFLKMSDHPNKPRYTPFLLDLLSHVKEELDLLDWEINENQLQELQNKLDENGSQALAVVIGDFEEPKFICCGCAVPVSYIPLLLSRYAKSSSGSNSESTSSQHLSDEDVCEKRDENLPGAIDRVAAFMLATSRHHSKEDSLNGESDENFNRAVDSEVTEGVRKRSLLQQPDAGNEETIFTKRQVETSLVAQNEAMAAGRDVINITNQHSATVSTVITVVLTLLLVIVLQILFREPLTV